MHECMLTLQSISTDLIVYDDVGKVITTDVLESYQHQLELALYALKF